MKERTSLAGSVLGAFLLAAAGQTVMAQVVASPAAALRLVLLDTGRTLVQERRNATLPAGQCNIWFSGLPETLEPASCTLVSGKDPLFEVREFRWLYDAASDAELLQAMEGRTVTITTASGLLTGSLVRVLHDSRTNVSGLVVARQGQGVEVMPADSIVSVHLLGKSEPPYLKPRLLASANSGMEGVHQLRLTYWATGINWAVYYRLLLPADSSAAELQGWVRMQNLTEAKFSSAEVVLACTEAGRMRWEELRQRDPLRPLQPEPVLRYRYGSRVLSPGQHLVGPGVLAEISLGEPVTIRASGEQYFQLVTARTEPETFAVYDGVQFSRYRSMRRNDWNVGTESHRTVEQYVEFANNTGQMLPPGRVFVYRQMPDGSVSFLGEDLLPLATTGATCSLRLGPAAGLIGERRRISYTEVVPLHVFEESFEIELTNQTADDQEVRVVEHLYRWHDYEIVRADTEYQEIAPQIIEFRPVVKSGGQRTVRYTVRYRW